LIIIKKSRLTIIFFVFIFGISFLLTLLLREPRVKLGENYIYCNPRAKINLKKHYQINLWDYKWPISETSISYSEYLKRAIRGFQKLYPNVEVKFQLLDFLSGPAELDQALKSNNAPDIYCSAFRIPSFNFARQIPVGFYLSKADCSIYLPNAINNSKYQGTLCYFPRWIAPGFWIGNQSLVESAGLSITKIQNNGWSWQDLKETGKLIGKDKYLLVGNLGINGLLPQLMANSGKDFTLSKVDDIKKLNLSIDFMDQLVQAHLIPPDCDQKMYERFLRGQVMFLGGIRPASNRMIYKRLRNCRADWQPVLLPIPTRVPGEKTLITEDSVIAIYRNKRTNGDDHLAVAVKLGQFLSCYPEITPWENLMVCPANKALFYQWIQNQGPNRNLYNGLPKWDRFHNLRPLPVEPFKLYSVVNDFVAQKISAAEVKIQLSQK
jgi:hypothetical protein